MKNENEQKKITPPLWAKKLLSLYCKQELLEDLEGDLNEVFHRNVASKGVFRSRLIYIADVIKFCRLYTIRKPKHMDVVSHIRLYRNYYTTSLRTIQRNKLFSAINIVGLSISMCVALLLTAFFVEMKSFDNFHTNADKIFRVNSMLHTSDGGNYNYASTSVLTEKRIIESVPHVERMATLHRGFDKDLTYNGKTIPFRGLWASKDFFNVFSFQVLSGNGSKALSDPNSIVLTESAAKKIFNSTDIIGKIVLADTAEFTVTAVIKDMPINSHVHFDMLGSFVTLDNQMKTSQSTEWLKWDNIWAHYVYLMVDQPENRDAIEKSLQRVSAAENKTFNAQINLYLEPLREIALGRNMSNSIGPTVDRSTFTMLGILCLVVMLSACFNYTNLSIARALRRTREIGVRKSMGASRRQVFYQFIFESVILSLFALVAAVGFFLLIRKEFIAMNSKYSDMIQLTTSLETLIYFIGVAIAVGVLAGLLPAAFFARLNTAVVLKDSAAVTPAKGMVFRKILIVFQYTLSMLFILMVTIGYKQYRYALSFDLGFNTENILAIDLQGADPAVLISELKSLPEVKDVARTSFVSSVGISYSGHVKYLDPSDSASIEYNFIDTHYIPMLEHKLLAGTNFNDKTSDEILKSQVIVNQQMLKWMKIDDPRDAIGEILVIEGVKNSVVGVVEDFHHERVNYPIRNFAFRYDPSRFQVLNVRLQSKDGVATMEKITAAWKKADTVHPFQAKFYKEHIEEAYNKLSWIIKIIGFIAVLAISIASLGLLGMVVFTTETRMKEISIRKTFGASVSRLMALMGKGFIGLLLVSALIAIPAGYYLMDAVIFGKIVYRAPIRFVDVVGGVVIIFVLAMTMIGSQTWKIANTNPSKVLRNE